MHPAPSPEARKPERDESLPPAPRKPHSLPGRIFSFVASFSVGVVVLLFLILLTILGTFAQVKVGLYDAQKTYFDSVWFWQEVGPISIPLPGVYLLLGILLVNMTAGGLIRIRKKPQTIGVIIAHFSIISLIVAGWVSFHWKSEGHLALYAGQQSNVIQAYQGWQLEVRELNRPENEVLIIKESEFKDCGGEKSRTFWANGLPFELKVSGYQRNSVATEEGYPMFPSATRFIDQYGLLPQPIAKENERNTAGCYVDFVTSSGKVGESLFTGTAWDPKYGLRPPYLLTVGERKFSVAMLRNRWTAPFTVKVLKVNVEYYPNTDNPKDYSSEVLVLDDGREERHMVGMNAPLRRKGWTFFQAQVNRHEAGEDPYTVFVVVKNPSDAWPMWCLIVATCGLLLHFIMKLRAFLRRQSSKSKTAAPLLPPEASAA